MPAKLTRIPLIEMSKTLKVTDWERVTVIDRGRVTMVNVAGVEVLLKVHDLKFWLRLPTLSVMKHLMMFMFAF